MFSIDLLGKQIARLQQQQAKAKQDEAAALALFNQLAGAVSILQNQCTELFNKQQAEEKAKAEAEAKRKEEEATATLQEETQPEEL